ncbi:hypothetical protein F511_30704 [Dorcoceras hygrometricum]|uniref:Uncharacterized protein n=1 Tax=Dorcoceras hygrometricum TaxID=472368 RepID=A0A2Z7C8Q4_9LAMI|nr:hypothetical protein F511_30704 [Dorcoceras hygrometricum]
MMFLDSLPWSDGGLGGAIQMHQVEKPKFSRLTLSLPPLSRPPSPRRRCQTSFRPFWRGDSVRKIFDGFLVQTSKGVGISVVDRIMRCLSSTVEGSCPSADWSESGTKSPKVCKEDSNGATCAQNGVAVFGNWENRPFIENQHINIGSAQLDQIHTTRSDQHRSTRSANSIRSTPLDPDQHESIRSAQLDPDQHNLTK